MENVAKERGLALQQHFPKIETDLITNPLMLGTSNLAILIFLICSFHFCRSLSYSP